MNLDLIWQKTLDYIKDEVKKSVYITWFDQTKLHSLNPPDAKIIVPLPIYQKHLNEKYNDIIVGALLKVTNSVYTLDFILKEDIKIDEPTKIEQNTLFDIDIQTTKKVEKYKHYSNLNKNYTFENFAIGPSNKLAEVSAKAVIESPGKLYNPLFIYGNSGLGKTHLMHAIGNSLEEKGKKVLYITSEQFKDDYVKIIKMGSNTGTNSDYIDYFKDKYRKLDVLIIDDIQFLSGASKTQEEFFHTFNILYNNGKQIIISSDRSPNDIKLLEDRLKTRFSGGVTVNIGVPDFELRKEILNKKIKAFNVKNIKEEVIDYIATNISDNVRSLEGAIRILLANSLMFNYNEITLPMAVEALKDSINKGTTEKADILRVQRAVADYFKISVDDLKGKKKTANIAFARQIAIYLSHSLLNETLERIGMEFGGKNHSTVIYTCRKIENSILTSPEIKNSIEKIKENI